MMIHGIICWRFGRIHWCLIIITPLCIILIGVNYYALMAICDVARKKYGTPVWSEQMKNIREISVGANSTGIFIFLKVSPKQRPYEDAF